MNLLPKSEVVRKKASERKQEIDEGLKLAKKVDSLREIVTQEEKVLTLFREQTLKVIREEIAPLIRERDDLKIEIEELKRSKEFIKATLESVEIINNY